MQVFHASIVPAHAGGRSNVLASAHGDWANVGSCLARNPGRDVMCTEPWPVRSRVSSRTRSTCCDAALSALTLRARCYVGSTLNARAGFVTVIA
jgi:hypothetical protein